MVTNQIQSNTVLYLSTKKTTIKGAVHKESIFAVKNTRHRSVD